MPSEIAAEAQRAGAYVVVTGLLLKAFDALVRWKGSRHAEDTSDLDLTLRAGAELREELRKRIIEQGEDSTRRLTQLQIEIHTVEAERDKAELELSIANAHIERLRLENTRLRNERDDHMADARVLRNRLLTEDQAKRTREDDEGNER